MEGKTLEQLVAEWFAARDELHAFEQRLGVLLQEMSDKEVPAPDLRLTSQNVEKLQRLVEEERRLADACRPAQLDELARQTSDELGLRGPSPTTTGCRMRTKSVACPRYTGSPQRAAVGFRVALPPLILDIAATALLASSTCGATNLSPRQTQR